MRITEPYTIYLRKLPSGRQVYYYQFRDENGKRSPSYSTGTDSLPKAKRICQRLYNEGLMIKGSTTIFETFAQGFFDDGSPYLKWRDASHQELKKETVKSYQNALKNQIMPYFKDMVVSKINPDTVKKWVVWGTDKWSLTTMSVSLATLRIILKSAVDKSILKSNPCSDIAIHNSQKKKRTLLTPDELKQIYHAQWGNEQYRQFVLLAMITGMRAGEVSALTKDDILENSINVRYSYSHTYGIGTTKTDKCRYVPIPQQLDLKSISDDPRWIFKGKKGEPALSNCVYVAFCRVCDDLQIDRKSRGITLHSLRNSFISYLQGENVPLQKIKATVGHTDESMTDWYTYWRADMLNEVYTAQEKLYKLITE